MLELYEHQKTMVTETRSALGKHKSVILRSPTGSGKTVCAAFITQATVAKGNTVLFCVHRRELIKQSIKTFDDCGIRHGLIAAGFPYNPLQQVHIASINTLARRMEKIRKPSLIIIDEAHHAISESWKKVISYFSSSHVVGLSATPWRLDGRGLKDIFGAMTHGPETSWLIDNKFLSPFRAFAPSMPDLRGVHTKMGDYAIDEIEQTMDKPTITGDAVLHYKKLAEGKRGIAFATTIRHSKHIAEDFNANGVPARHIDGEMKTEERDEAIELFRKDKIKILTSCNIISEGFDVPEMEVAILLRPTQSLSLYLQQVGRALRYVPDKKALILDHAGNIMNHGLPTDKFDWSLEGKKKKAGKGKTPMRTCPECYCCHSAAIPSCPECNYSYEVKKTEIKFQEGNLEEINQDEWYKRMSYMQVLNKARTRDELLAVAKARGYRPGWAYKIMKEREKNERDRLGKRNTNGVVQEVSP